MSTVIGSGSRGGLSGNFDFLDVMPFSVVRSSGAYRGEADVNADGMVNFLANASFSSEFPPCPECQSEYAYQDGILLVCPNCNHEWNPNVGSSDASGQDDDRVLDANGNELQNGDSVIVLKDLKVKGASSVVKAGTKVKKIRLADGDHNIDCKIDGIGAMGLKSEFVRKV